jgi:hypothetical protein
VSGDFRQLLSGDSATAVEVAISTATVPSMSVAKVIFFQWPLCRPQLTRLPCAIFFYWPCICSGGSELRRFVLENDKER